ncbi:MAG TPA: DUF2007 domain-containing protein [Sedimentisphaerales bacterium]|nr:DUF2007 domain-containing protein [Sedimentisphaerales bacterium]HQI29087.1 DUF2007 domain-containing protein [Sedimentisphaerales bacterium]
MKNAEKLVTVARYEDYVKADLARQLLEDEGIKAVVTGQNVANVYSGVPAVIDIELQTLESQAEQARQILEDADRQVVDQDLEKEDWSDEEDEDEGEE